VELRWIEAFLAVAEELHFGRAAQRLHMAQSPLSQVIRKLERELGTPLFERSTRVVELSPAGQAFLPHARRVLEELDLARRATTAGRAEVYGNVTIGFSGALNHLTLPPLTRAVRRRHPHIALSLVGRTTTNDAVARLQAGLLDLAFVGLPITAEGIDSRVISVEPLGVVAPSDHPLAGAATVELAQFADDDFVSMPAAPGSILRENMVAAAVESGFRPRVVQEVSDPYVVLSFVAAGVGVSVAPASLRPILPAGCVYLPIAGVAPTLSAGLAWRADDRSSALRAVLSVAVEVLPAPE
jgi:DNA-binding transcriptional LysR family regulator